MGTPADTFSGPLRAPAAPLPALPCSANPPEEGWGRTGAAPLRGAASPRPGWGQGEGTGPLRPAAGTSGRVPRLPGCAPGGGGHRACQGANIPRRGGRGCAAGCGQPDTHRGSPGAPAPAPALRSPGGGGGESGAGKQAPPSLTYFLPSLNVAPLTYFPTNPLPAGPGPAPRPPIAVPNPPSPPTNGGAAEPGYLPLPASQSMCPKGAGLGRRFRPIRTRLGALLASCETSGEAADQ